MRHVLLYMFATISLLMSAQEQPRSSIQQVSFFSETLGETFAYTLFLPAGYEQSQISYPTLYLLHGRGDSMNAWLEAREALDNMIAEGKTPPVVAILPDAPWSDGGSYYVDSLYTAYPTGKQVETAFFRDLIPQVESTYRTLKTRGSRVIGGYSMGGYGAIRYALAHSDIFANAIVLSPAVYTPLPPQDSSTREFGAFGDEGILFDETRYQNLNYPAVLDKFAKVDLTLNLFIAVGDDEYKNPRPEDALHDIDMEAHLLYNRVSRVPTIAAELRVYDGGHDWEVWRRGFIEGMQFIVPRLQAETN